MRVLVIGATGKVGSCVVEQLLALPSPPTVRVSSREPSKANFPSSVEVVQGDLTESSTYPALFASVDRVFLYAPHSRGGPSPVPQLIQALHTAGVRRVVFLSSLVSTCTSRPAVHSLCPSLFPSSACPFQLCSADLAPPALLLCLRFCSGWPSGPTRSSAACTLRSRRR